MQNISLWSSGMPRNQNFERVFGFKSDTAVLFFAFSLSLFFSLFLPHFFSLAGHLVGFILVGKVFRKAFRILGLDERKGKVGGIVEQDFHGNFQVNATWFFGLLLWCPWLNSAHYGMVWKISSLYTSWRTKSARAIKGGSGANGF